MTLDEALNRLLAKSGYVARQVGITAWRIERKPPPVAKTRPVLVPPPPPPPEKEIVVTGTKRDLRLADLPMAVSVVSLDEAHRFDPAAGTHWLSAQTEGLTLTNQGPGRNRMFLRGVADSPFDGDSQSTVAVVLDDTRLTYAAPDPDIRLVDVARVELLKGPQGSLYGTGTLGGIYHIVTQPAKLDETSVTVSIGGEAVAGGGLGPSGSAVANLPVARDGAALRLVGYASNAPGWIDTGTPEDSNWTRTSGLRGNLRVEPGDGWRLDLTAFGQWINSRDSQYVYRDGAYSRPAQLPEPHDNDISMVSGRIAKHAGDIDMVLSSGMTWHEVDDRFDATQGAESFGLSNPGWLNDQRHYRTWDSEARINGRTGAIDWLIGLSHLEASEKRDRVLFAMTPPASLTVDAQDRTTSESGLFGNLGARISSSIRIEAGGRLFHSVVKQSDDMTGQSARDEQTRDGFSPSASISWEPRSGRLFYLRYGSAVRQGVLSTDNQGRPEALEGDEVMTIEGGWREHLPGDGRLDAGVYYSTWQNLQSDVLHANGLIGTETAGNARIFGLEASLTQPVSSTWRFEAGVSFTQADLVKNELGFALDDSRLPVVPEYTLRGGVAHTVSLGSASTTIRATLRYLGPMHLSFDPALDRPMGNLLESRLEANTDWHGYTLGIGIDNFLARKADTFAFGNPLRFSIGPQFTPQQPLHVSFSLTTHF